MSPRESGDGDDRTERDDGVGVLGDSILTLSGFTVIMYSPYIGWGTHVTRDDEQYA